MTEKEEVKEKKGKLGLSRPGRLELRKTVDAGQVRQNFSHGRSKTVTVEVRRRRTFTQDSAGGMKEVQSRAREEAEEAITADEPATVKEAPAVEEAPAVVKPPRTLTGEERAARARALFGAKQAETDEVAERQRIEIEQEIAAEEARLREADEATRAAIEAAASAAAEIPASQPAFVPSKLKAAPAPAVPAVAEEEEREGPRRPGRPEPKRLAPRRGGEQRRRGGKLTIAQALDDEERMRSLASLKRSRERERRALQQRDESIKIVREVVVPEVLTVQELANRMAERAGDVMRALIKMGVMVTITQSIDADTAELVVNEFGHRIKRVSEADVEIGFITEDDAMNSGVPRAPIVTVMGHVDHGKTSLLDALRSTNVVAGEAGGITQHIGAYQVVLGSGQKITYLDTPGHEAFTAMRARGANVTDLVVLVVAADDGIMPQTVEAIHHAKAAGVPIIVAINKMDRPDADATRVRNELLQHELVVEELGGDILAVEVSATERLNLEKLEETILLQAELLELRANPNRTADGVVIEARLERGRGAIATLLVQRGTLKIGDIVVAGGEWGRARALISDAGAALTEAGPAVPVEILGMSGAPIAGDAFAVVENEARARELTEFRQRQARDARTTTTQSSLENMFSALAEGQISELPIIIKADVQGSVEAIQSSADKLGTDEVSVRVLHTGAGGINESDVTLAKASKALIVGFNVRANPQARDLAAAEKVDIRYYSIIYQLIDDLKGMLSGMLKPMERENFLGHATVQEVFNITKVGKVAGCRVTDGVVKRGSHVRLLRDDVVIHEGKLATLKRFKEEVREVREGFECGLALENYQDIKDSDVIECFDIEEVARTL